MVFPASFERLRVDAALFDFDGTLSILRGGWEDVMEPLMVEKLLACGRADEPTARRMARDYIDDSAGIQTIFQMKWLARQVDLLGGRAEDPWAYKDEYNRRLLERIDRRKQAIASGQTPAEAFLVNGAASFLRALREKHVAVYVASGTDHEDVVREARILGIDGMFDELMGAPYRQEQCSKETVLKALISRHHLTGDRIAVIGDGKVEIMLGKQAGARALGIASDEIRGRGENPRKRERLTRAGADAICGDFSETDDILAFMGLREGR